MKRKKPSGKVCAREGCNNDLTSYSQKQYCSVRCAALDRSPRPKKLAKKLVPYTCEICGKVKYDYAFKANKRRFCSRKCMGEGQRGKNNPHYHPHVEIECAHCGKVFTVTPSQAVSRDKHKIPRRFCSRECFGLFYRGHNTKCDGRKE